MKAGWEIKSLGEVIQLEYGKPLPPEDRNPNGMYPVYGANGEKDRTDKFYRDCPSIIVGRKGSAGEITLTEDRFWPLDVTYFVEFDSQRHDLQFLYYLLATLDLPKLAKGVKPGINRNEVYALPVAVPTRTEQQRIVALLDEAFDGIATARAQAEKNLQNARAVFESHLQSVFTQREDEWIEKPLGEVCSFSSGGTPAKSNSSYWVGEIPWVSGRDMKSTRLYDSLLHISRSAVNDSSARMAQIGTLLVLVRGMGLAHGAQIAELMTPCAFNQDIKAIHPEPGLIPRYLLFVLRERINSSTHILSNAAHGTLKIDSDALKSVLIPVPSLDQQQRIVATIDALSEETQRLESLYRRKLIALDELKKSLLQQAFSGQLTSAKQPSMRQQSALQTTTPEFSANVISFAYAQHVRQKREKTFGRVKEQKVLHLVESIARIDLGRHPMKDAAGPNDFQHMLKAEEWAKAQGFFEMVRRDGGYDFKKLSAFDAHLSRARQALEPYISQLECVIDILVPMDKEEAEVFATVHAAWNNLLIDGMEVTDDAIVSAAQEGWHPDKLKIPEHKFRTAIALIRQKKLIPDGTAKYVGDQHRLI